MLQSFKLLPATSEMADMLLGTSELEAHKNLSMLIDLLIIVEEGRSLNDPENNPDSVDLYKKLFGDDA